MLSVVPRPRSASRRRAVGALAITATAAVVALTGLSPAGGTTPRAATVTATRSAAIHAAANPATITVSDPTGDVQPPDPIPPLPPTFTPAQRTPADLADTTTPTPRPAAGIRVGMGTIRLSAQIPLSTDPTTDPVWMTGRTGITWALTVGPTTAVPPLPVSGNNDFLASLAGDPFGHLQGSVYSGGMNPQFICYANAAYDGAGGFSLSFPSKCIRDPINIAFYAHTVYDTSRGTDPNPATNQPHDYAPNVSTDPTQPQYSGVVSPDMTPTPDRGGLVNDRSGGVHPFTIGSNTPPRPTVSAYWPNRDVYRDFTMFPDGAHGYALDARGGLWGVALGQNQLPVRAVKNAYWNINIARGVAVMPDGTGGFVADAWGGLHWFSIGVEHTAPTVNPGASYWPGWDIVRGVTILPDGSGGYVLDAWGGLHPFGLSPGGPTPPAPTGGPYWMGWYIAQGVTVLPDGTGGYIADAWGVRHPFSLGSTPPPPTSGGAYWPGQNIARGLAAVWGELPLP